MSASRTFWGATSRQGDMGATTPNLDSLKTRYNEPLHPEPPRCNVNALRDHWMWLLRYVDGSKARPPKLYATVARIVEEA